MTSQGQLSSTSDYGDSAARVSAMLARVDSLRRQRILAAQRNRSAMRPGQARSTAEKDAGDPRVSALRARMDALRSQSRSDGDFATWKPDVFYYLIALALTGLVAGIWWNRPWTNVAAGLALVLQVYLPHLWNGLGYWVTIRLPNYLLQRRIDSLEAQIQRRKEGSNTRWKEPWRLLLREVIPKYN
jgi:hypothetical protein